MSTETEKIFTWKNATEFGIRGGGWAAEQLHNPFHRLPPHAEAVVPQRVWNLSLASAGLMVDFRTDADEIRVRWTLQTDAPGATGHTTGTVAAGLDCYGFCEHSQQWHWVGAQAPWRNGSEQDGRFNTTPLDGQSRVYRVYLPIGWQIQQLELGVPEGAEFCAAPVQQDRLIVSYGTSIVHGWSVGRPGMAHP